MAATCFCLLHFCLQNSCPKVDFSVQMVRIEGGKPWYSFLKAWLNEHLGRLATCGSQTQRQQGKPLPGCLSVWQLTRVVRSKIHVKEHHQWDFILEA